MKKIFATLLCSIASILPISAQLAATSLNGANYTQNFNAIATQSTPILPGGWGINAATTYSGAVVGLGAFAGTTGTGAFSSTSSGASYLMINGVAASGTDKAIGYLSSGTYSKNRNILFGFTNASGSTIQDLQLSWNYEKYRSGSQSRVWTFFASTSDTAWGTAIAQGGFSYPADAVNGSVINPPQSSSISFTLANVNITNGGMFYLRWNYDGSGTGTSAQALGIDDFSMTASFVAPKSGPPVITSQPINQTVWSGTNVTFTVAATGAEPISYQWNYLGSPIGGATTSSLALSVVTTNNAGAYRVVVTNPEGSVNSDTATLTVQSPTISTIAGLRSLVDTVNWVPTDNGNLYQTEGIVTTYANLSASADGSCFIQDATGGIAIFVSGGSSFRPLIGDRVKAVGRLGHVAGLLQLSVVASNPTHKAQIIGAGNPLPAAFALGFDDQFNIPLIEALEGSRVSISNVFIDLTSPTFTAGSTVKVTNSANLSQTFELRIDARLTDFNGQSKPTAPVKIIGVMSQSDATDPRTSGYQIMPTRFADILPGPTIITQPQHQTAVVGDGVTLSVSATGPGLMYQWRKNGEPIANATGSSYVIQSVAHSDGGHYSVLVSNTAATVPSATVFLGVGTGSVSLVTYNVKGNFAADFSTNAAQVQAIGRQLAYLQPDIITLNEIPNGQTFEVTNLVRHYLPGYFCATNSGTDGAIRSVILSRWRVVRSQSWLDAAPLDAFGYVGNFTRDLFEAQVDVPGFLQPLHLFTTHLKSSGDLDSATKRAAEAGAISNFFVHGFLTTNSSHPYIITGDLNEDVNRPQPTSQRAIQRLQNNATGLQLTTPVNPYTGDDRTFSIQSLPLQNRYDYILPCSSLSAHVSTSQVFRTSLLTPLPPGLNANDDATAADHLPVFMQFANPFNVPPVIIGQPQNTTVASGSGATFQVQVGSAVPVTYSWKKGGVDLSNDGNVSGVGTATLSISAATVAEAGVYSVVVSNVYGFVTSAEATLSIAVPPSITSPPISRTNVVGSTATFTVEASGTQPLSFQWSRNNSPLSNGGRIAGAKSSTLIISNLVEADAGAFSVTITNLAGIAESSVSTLSVVATPVITAHPVSRTIAENSGTTLSVMASGPSLSYQWFFNSGLINDATSSSYDILDASASEGGNYFVVVENTAGAVTSLVARVQVAIAQTALFSTNIVVLRLGDGIQSLSALGNATYLDQFTFDGNYLGTMGIPDVGTEALVMAGNTASEGALSRSANGMYLTFGGYNTERLLTGSVNGAAAASVHRVVGQVDGLGTFGLPAKTTSQFSGNSFRSAVSDGLSNYWGAGGSSGTYYLGTASIAAPVQNTIANTRVLNAFNGNLYFSTSSGTRGIYKISGYPRSTATSSVVVSTGAGSSPYGFAINADETIVYVADDSPTNSSGGIQRWDKIGESWTNNYTLGTGSSVGARGIAVDFVGAQPVLYATTAEGTSNRVIRIVDAGAASPAVTIATAGANQAFRGVQFGPEQPLPPAILAGPESLSLLQGEAAAFNVSVSGAAPFTYQWRRDGDAITGATASSYSIAAVMPGDAGDYSVIVSNAVGYVTSDPAVLAVAGDSLAPDLKLISPKANGVYSNSSSVVIQGTVVEAVRLVSLTYHLNGAGIVPANTYFVAAGKPTNWNATVSLKPGTNVLTVVATDLGGNVTTLGPITFFYHAVSPLRIEVTLDGGSPGGNVVGSVLTNTIPPALYSTNNTNLFVGRTYLLKAVETGMPDYILTNWTAVWEGQLSPVVLQTNNTSCTFEMKSNMIVKANFITNPFLRFGGIYNGLFSEAANLRFKSAGFALIKVSPKLAISGKIFVDGNAVGFSGKMKLDGTGTFVTKTRVKATDKPELTVDVAIDFLNGSETMTGNISDGTWTSPLRAYRNVWGTNLVDNATEYTNAYTMLLPGFETAEGPVGSGYALVKLDTVGKVKGAGHTADRHVLKSSTVISEEGHWPFFGPQYKLKRTNALDTVITETKGFVMGWLQFTPNAFGHMAPTGELHWIKTGDWTNTTIYPAGFTNSADVVASRWIAPVPSSGDRAVNMIEAALGFTQGDLSPSIFANYLVTTNTTFAMIKIPPTVYPYNLKASLAPKTGLIKGSFIHPLSPGPEGDTVTKWFGAMLQDQNYGAGFFMGPTVGGKVEANAVVPPVE